MHLARTLLALTALSCAATFALASDDDANAKNVVPADKAPAKDEQKSEFAYVELTTSMGPILLELNQAKAPISCENFLTYVKDGHYNGTIFHRVIENFMIQGGGFTKDMKEKSTRSPIKNEWKNGLINKKGTIAMARTNDPNSATAQFYINVADNDFLSQARDGAGYAVFGKVVQGMDVVDKIKAAKTGIDRTTGMEDVPTSPIEITSAKVLTSDEAKSKMEQKEEKKDEKKPESK